MSLLVERTLPDVQAGGDERGVALDDVGITGLRYPATVECADGSVQQTICEAQLSVALAAPTRGTHMSRFVEALHEQREILSPVRVLDDCARPRCTARRRRSRDRACVPAVRLA